MEVGPALISKYVRLEAPTVGFIFFRSLSFVLKAESISPHTQRDLAQQPKISHRSVHKPLRHLLEMYHSTSSSSLPFFLQPLLYLQDLFNSAIHLRGKIRPHQRCSRVLLPLSTLCRFAGGLRSSADSSRVSSHQSQASPV
jgi:hypothetical protein